MTRSTTSLPLTPSHAAALAHVAELRAAAEHNTHTPDLPSHGVNVQIWPPFRIAGAVAFVLLFGLGFTVGTISRPALPADAYGTASDATLSALGSVALTAAKVAGPIAAGLAVTATGSWTQVLLGLLAAAAVVSVAAARAGRLLTHRHIGSAAAHGRQSHSTPIRHASCTGVRVEPSPVLRQPPGLNP